MSNYLKYILVSPLALMLLLLPLKFNSLLAQQDSYGYRYGYGYSGENSVSFPFVDDTNADIYKGNSGFLSRGPHNVYDYAPYAPYNYSYDYYYSPYTSMYFNNGGTGVYFGLDRF